VSAPGTRIVPASSLIDVFVGEHAWLSNFSPSPLTWQGIAYPTAEAAFQAGKTLDANLRQRIADAPTPGHAKQLGRQRRLRDNWNAIRHDVMAEVLLAKFTMPGLREKLIATGTALLVEGNQHCDSEWGWCRCPRHRWRPGHNYLGRQLMSTRATLNPAIAGRWPQVAVTGHRPHGIPANLRGWVRDELARIAAKLVSEHGMEVGISGLAIGTDLWFADAVRAAGARVWGYSPYPQQDQRWSRAWQQKRQDIMAYAERVEHLGDHFDNALLHLRSMWLIRDAQALVAVVDPRRTTGGTVAAVRYATGRIPIIRVDIAHQDVRLVGAHSNG
jgi:ribA/ribD-fused uncharacterized protein